MLNKGILSQDQIEKLGKLVFTPHEKEVIDQIGYNAKKLRKAIRTYTFYAMLSISTLFVLFILGTSLPNFSKTVLYLLFGIVLAIQLVYSYHSVYRAGLYANTYKRLTGALLDNILFLIIDDFRISLAGNLARIPNPKEISESISKATLPSLVLSNTLGMLLGIFIGILGLLIQYILSGNDTALVMFVVTLAILILYVIFLYFGSRFLPKQKSFVEISDGFDIDFKSTQPLLFRSHLEFYPTSFYKALNSVVSTTTIINGINRLVDSIIPVIIVFFPLLFLNNDSTFLILLSISLYVISKTFGTSQVVSNYYEVKIAEERLKTLDTLLDTILEIGSELTPDYYDLLKKEYLKKNPGQMILDTYTRGDFNIVNLEYISGRDSSKRSINVAKATLKSGKVNFLKGNSGSGKSIFGRLLTLRYSDFKSTFLGVKGYDIRTFRSLDKGLQYLHFSGLRPIHTSYRQAVGAYLHPSIPQTLITQKLNLRTVNMNYVRKHFQLNADYYKEAWSHILGTLNAYKKDPKLFVAEFNALTESERQLVSQCYKSKLSSQISPKLHIFALVMEFYSFAHLRTFIPEASLYFMDAILSEPPISQGQRRRILFALDVLVEGSVFVVDEPFSNLDIETAKKVLVSLVNYARTHNSVVLILDQDINSEILSACKPSALGTFLSIHDIDEQTSEIVDMYEREGDQGLPAASSAVDLVGDLVGDGEISTQLNTHSEASKDEQITRSTFKQGASGKGTSAKTTD